MYYKPKIVHARPRLKVNLLPARYTAMASPGNDGEHFLQIEKMATVPVIPVKKLAGFFMHQYLSLLSKAFGMLL